MTENKLKNNFYQGDSLKLLREMNKFGYKVK